MILTIPSLLIFTSVYERKTGNGQDIIDRPDSAVMFQWNRLTIIADHSHQNNFGNLNRAIPGKTKLYLINGRVQSFVCDSTEVGFIYRTPTMNILHNSKGEELYRLGLDGLVIYTCVAQKTPNAVDVRLTHWHKI